MIVRAARLARAVLPAAAALVIAVQAPLWAGVALTEGQFDDPFANCAAVETIDAPDARYTGFRVPEAVARGLKAAMHLPAEAPLGPLFRNSIWRCMDGKVYACTLGANLPCAEKADTRTEPSAPVTEFCRQNPGADVVPMVVTGQATVFASRCAGEHPAIIRQFPQPDVAGYLANIWYAIEPATP
jgi:hypothetical protein